MKKLFVLILALVVALTGSTYAAAETFDRPEEAKAIEWLNGYSQRCKNNTKKRKDMTKTFKKIFKRVLLAPIALFIGIASAEPATEPHIWHYDPKKETVWFPKEDITVPRIKSIEKARKLNDVDPKEYRFTVVTKTGTKLVPFYSKDDAEDYALKNCSKKSCRLVYEGDKVVSAFVNGKKLPDFVIVYNKVHYDPIDKETFEDWERMAYIRPGKKAKVVTDELYSTTIEKTDDRVRIQRKYLLRYKLKNGHKAVQFKKESFTIHKDGRSFLYKNGSVFHTGCINVEEEAKEVVIGILKSWDSKKGSLLNKNYSLEYIAKVWAKPNLEYVTDGFKGTKASRNSFVHIESLWKFFPREVTDEVKLVDIVAAKAKVPTTKMYRKLYLKDIGNILLVKHVMECGIKDVNNVIKVPHLGMALRRVSEREIITPFIRKICEIKGEDWLVKAVMKEGASALVDAGRMGYNTEEETGIAIINEATNIQQIHDTLVRESRKNVGKLENKQIPYSKREMSYEKTYGNVSFVLPKDTLTLAIVGQKMGICVGGYGYSAVNKDCTIVTMVEAGKYIGCIELRGNRMCQLKAKFNNPMKEDYRPIIRKWVSECEIDPSCDDYRRIGHAWNSNTNYAHVDPAQFEERHEFDRLIVESAPGKFNPREEIDSWLKDDTVRIKHEPVDVEFFELYGNMPFRRNWDVVENPAPEFVPVETDELPF